MQDFIVKLGQSKAEKLQSEFTMVHNETAYQIIREIGPEAFAMYFTLSSLAFGKTTVMIDPDNQDLQELVGKCERTVQRWKAKLQEANIIRVAPCFNLNGLQVANVIIFNAAYPEVPEGWNTFAPNGFVQVSQDQPPMVKEEYEKMIAEGVAILEKKRHRNAQGKPRPTSGGNPDRSVTPRGDKCVTPAPTDLSPLGVTNVSPSKSPKNPGGSKARRVSHSGEDFKDINKTNKYIKSTETNRQNLNLTNYNNVIPDTRRFYQLFPDA